MAHTFGSKEWEKDFVKQLKPEVMLNRGDDLPFGYYNPEDEGNTRWHCGRDAQGAICSVFTHKIGTETQKNVEFIDMNRALFIRDELKKAKWQPIQPPQLEFKFKDAKNQDQPLSRKQKRILARKVKTLMKKNPFENEQTTKKEDNEKES